MPDEFGNLTQEEIDAQKGSQGVGGFINKVGSAIKNAASDTFQWMGIEQKNDQSDATVVLPQAEDVFITLDEAAIIETSKKEMEEITNQAISEIEEEVPLLSENHPYYAILGYQMEILMNGQMFEEYIGLPSNTIVTATGNQVLLAGQGPISFENFSEQIMSGELSATEILETEAKLALAASADEKKEIMERFYSTGKYSPDDEAAKLMREVLYGKETRFMNVDELMVQYMLQLTGDVVIDPTADKGEIKPLLDENGNTIAEPYEFGEFNDDGDIIHDVAMRDENGDIVVRDENGDYVDPESIGETIADNEFVGDVIESEKEERLLYSGDTNESLNTYHDCISFVDEMVYIFYGSHIGYDKKTGEIINAQDPANTYDYASLLGLNLISTNKIDYEDLPPNTIVFWDFDTEKESATAGVNRSADHIGFFVGFNRDGEPLIIDASGSKRGVSVKLADADNYSDNEVGYIPYPYW